MWDVGCAMCDVRCAMPVIASVAQQSGGVCLNDDCLNDDFKMISLMDMISDVADVATVETRHATSLQQRRPRHHNHSCIRGKTKPFVANKIEK